MPDDNAAPALPLYVRFRGLKQANIVTSWPQLKRLIVDQGFPPGVMLSPNIRAWTVDEVQDWLADRPTDRKAAIPLRPGSKRGRRKAS